MLTLPVANQLAPDFTRVAGVITATNGFAGGAAPVKAMTLDAPLTGAVVAGPKPASAQAPGLNLAAPPSPAADGLSLALALAFAFIGGIVLNLMPCVFPVLSLKALALTRPGHGDRHHLRIEGLSFGAGVIGTFVALAGLLLVLRAAGEQFGWGFQLQSPAVVTGLALLFFILALNLSGVFEFRRRSSLRRRPAGRRATNTPTRRSPAFSPSSSRRRARRRSWGRRWDSRSRSRRC